MPLERLRNAFRLTPWQGGGLYKSVTSRQVRVEDQVEIIGFSNRAGFDFPSRAAFRGSAGRGNPSCAADHSTEREIRIRLDRRKTSGSSNLVRAQVPDDHLPQRTGLVAFESQTARMLWRWRCDPKQRQGGGTNGSTLLIGTPGIAKSVFTRAGSRSELIRCARFAAAASCHGKHCNSQPDRKQTPHRPGLYRARASIEQPHHSFGRRGGKSKAEKPARSNSRLLDPLEMTPLKASASRLVREEAPEPGCRAGRTTQRQRQIGWPVS